MNRISDVRVVATSLVVSVSDVVLNFLVAFFTGSTVMLSQGLQGLSDLIVGGILFFGVKRSNKKADHKYHFGYGREVFFWVLMAGTLMFIGTGGLSVYFGWQQIVNPSPVSNVWIAFAILIFGASTNGYAFSLSFRRLRKLHPNTSWLQQLLRSSLVETKTTFIIDFLGTTAAVTGLVAIGLYLATGNPVFDGVGSMTIGLCMMFAATLLIRDVRALIVGRAIEPEITHRISKAALSVPGILSILDLRTMYLGSAKILVILEVHMQDKLDTDQIEKIVDTVKEVVRRKVPEVYHIQVEIETPDQELSLE